MTTPTLGQQLVLLVAGVSAVTRRAGARDDV